MGFQARILTLYPEIFPGLLSYSLAGQVLARGIWLLETVPIGNFVLNKCHSVDNRLVDARLYSLAKRMKE